MGEDSSEEKLLRDILTIEKHEDRMITAMVQLMASSERLNRRLGVLTWIMLILTWITFIIAIPNTLATIFGIPKVSDVLGLADDNHLDSCHNRSSTLATPPRFWSIGYQHQQETENRHARE